MALHSAVRGLLAGRRRLVELRLRLRRSPGRRRWGRWGASHVRADQRPSHRPLTQLPRVPRGPNIY